MGFILIALLGLLVVWITAMIVAKKNPGNKVLKKDILIVCTVESAILLCMFGCMGLFYPPTEYEVKKVDEVIELERFKHNSMPDNTFCYLTKEYGNHYTYYTKNGDDYEVNSLITDNMSIIQDDFGDKATLTRYVSKAKESFWTFAIGHDEYKYEYVFSGPFAAVADLDYYR